MLVERGLVESRTKAQALIMAGEVLVDGKAVNKSGALVAEGAASSRIEPPCFLSRGGIKLGYVLNEFQLDVSSKVVADVGASSGGFTG